ncbi:MAG: TetR/AcrR family transcriptional regulator [Prevotella sp.]|nr:TetR/AcrR family transcriptional regulator [Prevotella sp.]
MANKMNPESYRESLKSKILEVAMHEFMSKGIRAVKMDDIASLLGISKRTLYEVYSNKEALLLECLKKRDQEIHLQQQEFMSCNDYNVIEILMKFYDYQMSRLANTNPIYLADLHRYRLVMEFLEQHHRKQADKARAFFARGVEEGYFRSDVDYEIVSRIGEASMNYVMTSQMYNQYPLQHIYHNIILLFIRGFCSEKGIAEIDRVRTKE